MAAWPNHRPDDLVVPLFMLGGNADGLWLPRTLSAQFRPRTPVLVDEPAKNVGSSGDSGLGIGEGLSGEVQ